MEKIKYWSADISGGIASCLCWFSPEHCNYIATILAMLIGFVTFFFVTLPKAWPNIRKLFKREK